MLLADAPVTSAVPGTTWPVVGRVLGRRWFARAWFGLSAAVSAAVLVLTQSRGAWIGTAAAVGILLLCRWKRLAWLAPLALLGVGWVGWRAVPPLVEEAPSGQMGRIELWSRAIYLIQDMPLTGIGAGTFERMADTQFPFFLHGSWVEHVHNLFLQVAVDLGLPGLVAYLALLLLALWCALDAARRCRQAGESALAALAWAGLAALVAMCVHGMVDATTWIVGRGAFVPWAVIGAILAVHRTAVYTHCTEEAT
jgi:putative inorganic carbon (hco3(-)) transporter